jgi:hypothetical protein
MQHKLLLSVNNGLKVLEMYAWLLDSYVLVSLDRYCELEVCSKALIYSDQQIRMLTANAGNTQAFQMFFLAFFLNFESI